MDKHVWKHGNRQANKQKKKTEVWVPSRIGVTSIDAQKKAPLPARVDPFLANLRSPFFFRIKLPPMKMLELTASAKPM